MTDHNAIQRWLGWGQDNGTEPNFAPEEPGYSGLVQPPHGPGQWSVDKRGKNGTKYRLRFHDGRFHWISRLDEHKGLYLRFFYWKVVWRRNKKHDNVRVGSTLQDALADIGYDDAVAFVNARHVRLAIQPPPPPPAPPPPRVRDYIRV